MDHRRKKYCKVTQNYYRGTQKYCGKAQKKYICKIYEKQRIYVIHMNKKICFVAVVKNY